MDVFDKLDSMVAVEVPTEEEKSLLLKMVYTTTLNEEERNRMIDEITFCIDYRAYERLQFRLEDLQMPLDQMAVYGQGDIKNHFKKFL